MHKTLPIIIIPHFLCKVNIMLPNVALKSHFICILSLNVVNISLHYTKDPHCAKRFARRHLLPFYL